MEVGNQIRELRKQHKISQKNLANQIGVAQSAIANYETGLRTPNHEILIKLANYFDVSLDKLMCRMHENTNWHDVAEVFFKSLMHHDLDSCLGMLRHMMEKGINIQDIYLKIIKYALVKIGWLWETGVISVADEHLMVYELEKVMGYMQSDIKISITKDKKIMGLLPHGELHEMPMKLALDLLKYDGYDTYYLGRNIPETDLIKFIKDNEIETVLISATMESSEVHARSLANRINDHIRCEIYLGGQAFRKLQFDKEGISIEDGFKIVSTYQVLMEALR